MKENIFSVVIALMLASFIFFGLLINFDNFDSLQNNVIGVEVEELSGDLIVETYQDRIEIIANKNSDQVSAMSVMLFWDETEVTPLLESITSMGNAEVTETYGSRVTVFVNSLSGFQKDDSLITLPLEGKVSQVSVSDIVLLFNDDSSERASISVR